MKEFVPVTQLVECTSDKGEVGSSNLLGHIVYIFVI